MAESTQPKPISLEYSALGGINIKASEYSTGKAQFLDIRNLDFDVPNALQKRPGSSQAVAVGTSGPISSLFEFIKLDGSSYIVAGSDTAMFYLASNAYTLLSSGWNNGQPTDMLTFQNKLWMANGQKWEFWGATGGVSAAPVGLPMQQALIVPQYKDFNGASYFLVGGATHWPNQTGGTFTLRGVYVAYSYLRSDGYVGPAQFLQSARNIVVYRPPTSGDEAFGGGGSLNRAMGFTIPADYGISAIQIWVGVDTVVGANGGATLYLGATWGIQYVGQLGWNDQFGGASARRMSYSMHPNADLSRFHLWTSIPGTSLFLDTGYTGYPAINPGNVYSATLLLTSPNKTFAALDGVAASDGFSGVNFGFFGSYVPKYIEQSNNIMFTAGFSSSPSTVWFSEVGEPEFYQPDSNFEVRTNDGDRILALKEFQNQLMVFKETSFHKLVGDSADNFNLVQISNEFGCLSNRCVIPFGNDLLFLDKKGIVKYNGASWDVISSPVESAFRRMNIDAAREKATAVNNTYRNQVWFAIPVDGSTENNLTVVYDYLVQAWTFFDGYNPSAYAAVRGQLTQPTAWRGDYSGLIHFTGSSFYSDSGRAITCLTFSRFDKMQGENETSIWRRYFLDVAPVSGATTPIQGQVFSDYNHSTVQATFSIYQTLFQSRAEMGVVGKAVAIQLSHASASLPLLINGYALAKRGLRNV